VSQNITLNGQVRTDPYQCPTATGSYKKEIDKLTRIKGDGHLIILTTKRI